MKRVFFFDLVGTLIRPRAPIGQQYAAVARRFGANLDAGALGAAFHRAMSVLPAVQSSGESLEETASAERRWWKDLVRSVVTECDATALQPASLFDAYFAALYEHFTTNAAWTVFPDAPAVLDALEAAGVSAGLITNYDTRVYRVLDALDLSGRLDSVTIPANAGVSKPDPRIFAYALARHAIGPGEALHVGDSPGDDYDGATAAGIDALLLDRDNRHAGRAGTRRVGGLAEVLEREL